MFQKFEKALPEFKRFIEISFLPKKMQKEYVEIVIAKAKQLEIKG